MLYANHGSDKLLATPGAVGSCPSCWEPLRPKCGQIVDWHWAHISDTGCTREHEPETEWHRDWKMKFPKANVEVPVGNHRADVRAPDGTVIEFQHSGITAEQIEAREQEYGRMVWVLDGRDAYYDGRIRLAPNPTTGYLNIHIARWRTTLKHFTCPVFIDTDSCLGDLVHVRDFSQRKQTKAERFFEADQQLSWGYGGSYEDFVNSLMSGNLPWWMASPKLQGRMR